MSINCCFDHGSLQVIIDVKDLKFTTGPLRLIIYIMKAGI